jgi:hypothetical protein
VVQELLCLTSPKMCFGEAYQRGQNKKSTPLACSDMEILIQPSS